MSGLNLIEIGALICISLAIFLILSYSEIDSILKDKIPALIPAATSTEDLPTPENIIFLGSAPAFRALKSSPPETISKPAP